MGIFLLCLSYNIVYIKPSIISDVIIYSLKKEIKIIYFMNNSVKKYNHPIILANSWMNITGKQDSV